MTDPAVTITPNRLLILQWIVEDAVETSRERVEDGGMEAQDRQSEVEDIDEMLAMLREAGAGDAFVDALAARFVSDATRAEIAAHVSAAEDEPELGTLGGDVDLTEVYGKLPADDPDEPPIY